MTQRSASEPRMAAQTTDSAASGHTLAQLVGSTNRGRALACDVFQHLLGGLPFDGARFTRYDGKNVVAMDPKDAVDFNARMGNIQEIRAAIVTEFPPHVDPEASSVLTRAVVYVQAIVEGLQGTRQVKDKGRCPITDTAVRVADFDHRTLAIHGETPRFIGVSWYETRLRELHTRMARLTPKPSDNPIHPAFSQLPGNMPVQPSPSGRRHTASKQ